MNGTEKLDIKSDNVLPETTKDAAQEMNKLGESTIATTETEAVVEPVAVSTDSTDILPKCDNLSDANSPLNGTSSLPTDQTTVDEPIVVPSEDDKSKISDVQVAVDSTEPAVPVVAIDEPSSLVVNG